MEFHSWEELEGLVRQGREKIDQEEKNSILEAVFELKDEPFPESDTELFWVINRELSGDAQKVWINDI